jgi:hypothetical protein
MQKTLWTALAVLCLAIAAPCASADTYTLNFTGPSPFSASFDATGNGVTSVTVIYEGTTYTLTSANFLYGVGIGLDCASLPTPTFEFLMLTGTADSGCSGVLSLPGVIIAEANGDLLVAGTTEDLSTGTLTTSMYFTQLAPNSTEARANWDGATLVSTPEPSTVVLMLAGIGLVAASRRRLGRVAHLSRAYFPKLISS